MTPLEHVPDPVSLVVPCAGWGRRLALPWPKELMALGPGCTLIDAALAPFLAAATTAGGTPRVVVVVRGHKLDTLRYLAGYQNRVDLVAVFQPGNDDSLADAVAAALPYTTARNVVVLPDQMIGATPDSVAVADACIRMLSDSAVAVAAHRTAPQALTGEGALRTTAGPIGLRATAWQDHPDHPEHFDAAWVALCFTRPTGRGVVDALRSLERGTELTGSGSSVLIDAPVVLSDRYVNVSTWDTAAAVLAHPELWRP